MTASDQHGSSDERFERLLLESAQSDELPSNVDAAWHKFDAALHGVSVLAAGAAGALSARRAQHWLAAKWLIGGVLTGSALTALSLHASHEQHAQPSAALSAAIAVPAASNNTSAARIERTTPQPESPATTTAARSAPRSTRAGRPPSPSAAAPQRSSTLAAQVSMLDAARSALAAGAFAEALRLAERYRTDFPGGELAPEAEVVAIEALVERADRKAASERAARFLARYPGDPHTARVKWLVR
jgi:hypothetical protein